MHGLAALVLHAGQEATGAVTNGLLGLVRQPGQLAEVISNPCSGGRARSSAGWWPFRSSSGSRSVPPPATAATREPDRWALRTGGERCRSYGATATATPNATSPSRGQPAGASTRSRRKRVTPEEQDSSRSYHSCPETRLPWERTGRRPVSHGTGRPVDVMAASFGALAELAPPIGRSSRQVLTGPGSARRVTENKLKSSCEGVSSSTRILT